MSDTGTGNAGSGDEESRGALAGRLPHSLGTYRVPLGILLIVVLLRPVVSHPLLLGYEQIASTMLVWMLLVASFNILLGYTGLLTFGHAMFLGIGMYAVAIGTAKLDIPFLLSAVLGLVVAVVFAYLVARLIVQKGEIYFAMLTLAFAKSVHFVANYDPADLTGGSSGIASGALPSWIQTVRGSKYVVFGGYKLEWYYAVAVVFTVGMLLIWQLVRSPFGRTLIAIRENEHLARSMGVDTRRYKVWAFTFSGLFAAVAGVLLEVNDQGATLSALSVSASGNVILMAVLGGANYFFGPLAGAFVWLFAGDYLPSFETLVLPLAEFPLVSVELGGVLEYWEFFLGLLFVVAVLISPREGVWGLFRNGTIAVYDRVRGERE